MDLKFLVQTELFRDCAPEDLEQLLERMEARTDTYQKDEVIFHTGPVSYTHLDVYKRQAVPLSAPRVVPLAVRIPSLS